MEVNRHTTSRNLAYKETVVGILPCDWTVRELGSLVTITSGESPSLFSFCDSGTPYFKVDQLNNSIKLLGSTYTDYFISASPKAVPCGSVLFPKRGASIMLNKVRLLEEDGYMDTNVMALTPNGDINGDYLFYIISYFRLSSVADITSIPQINNKHIVPFQIPYPSLAEQCAIAEALSDIDGLLAALDALIAKKRAMKQATMQQLLTSKTRLPGFNRDWRVKRLDELGDFSGAGIDKKVSMNEVPVRLVNYLDVYHKTFLYSKDITHEVSAKPEHVQRCLVKKGDIFFTPTSEVRDDIGRSAVAMEDIPDGVYSYHVLRFRLKTNWNLCWDLRFRAYAFNTKRFFDQASMRCEGSGTRYVITLPKFRAIVVHFPPCMEEQQAIASVLFDMDAEIAALERRRDKARAIKQSMMQVLLTGKVRLVKPNHDKEGLTC